MSGPQLRWRPGPVRWAWLVALLVASCRRDAPPAPDPVQIAKREARAFARLLDDGERARDCTVAVAVMTADFTRDAAVYVASAAQTANLATVKAVTDHAEAHPDELPDLDPRWFDLFDRCRDTPGMKQLAAQIAFPTAPRVPGPAPEPPR